MYGLPENVERRIERDPNSGCWLWAGGTFNNSYDRIWRITIEPSVAGEGVCSRSNRGCPGWHGRITNGEAA